MWLHLYSTLVIIASLCKVKNLIKSPWSFFMSWQSNMINLIIRKFFCKRFLHPQCTAEQWLLYCHIEPAARKTKTLLSVSLLLLTQTLHETMSDGSNSHVKNKRGKWFKNHHLHLNSYFRLHFCLSFLPCVRTYIGEIVHSNFAQSKPKYLCI